MLAACASLSTTSNRQAGLMQSEEQLPKTIYIHTYIYSLLIEAVQSIFATFV
jgi:hypothetical protein